jgi:hypothetical protein
VIGDVQVPHAANSVHERPRRGMTLAQGERARLQQCQRPGRVGAAGGGEQDPEATVGVADEMGTVAHQLGDVVAVTQEVLALGGGTLAIAPPIDDEQAKAFVG